MGTEKSKGQLEKVQSLPLFKFCFLDYYDCLKFDAARCLDILSIV